MVLLPVLLAYLTAFQPALAEETPSARAAEARALLDQALALAQTVPDVAQRADAVGRVAAEVAKTDPKQALKLVADQMATHQQSEAMARAAETLAQSNRLLGLATLIRVPDGSSALVAIGRIIAMEALTDYDEAVNLTAKIDALTIRRQTEREVSRIVWDELPGDKTHALQVAVVWAQGVSDPATKAEALAYAAQGLARLVGAEAAGKVVNQIADREMRDLGWRLVIQEVAAHDPSAAQVLLGRTETAFQHNVAAAAVVAGLAGAGRREEALRLAGEVRSAVEKQLEDPRDQGLIFGELASALATVEPQLAQSLLSEVWPPADQYALQARLAAVMAQKDSQGAREMLTDSWVELRRMDAPLLEDEVAADCLAAAVQFAPDFVPQMRQEQPEAVRRVLPAAVLILAPTHSDLALKLAESIEDPTELQRTKAAVVESLAPRDLPAARRLAESLSEPGAKSRALVALAVAIGGGAG